MEHPSSSLACSHTQCHILRQSSKSIFSTSEMLKTNGMQVVRCVRHLEWEIIKQYIPFYKNVDICMLGLAHASF